MPNTPKPTDPKDLVSAIAKHLRGLNEIGLQRIPEDHISTLAFRQAQLLAFMGTRPRELKCEELIYQAMIDYALTVMTNADDPTILQFFDFVGHQIDRKTFTAWFFSKQS